jgi:hypothetical protein
LRARTHAKMRAPTPLAGLSVAASGAIMEGEE